MRLSELNKYGLIVVFYALFLGAVFLLPGCGKQNSGKKKNAQAAPLQSVKLIKVKLLPDMVRSFPGRVKPANEATLSFRVSGLVEHIPVTVGQVLKEGDLIARLDAAYYQDALSSAKANLESIQAKFKDARLNFERNQELWASKDIDASEMDAAQARYRSLKERVEDAKAAVSEARDDLRHTFIYAPYDGSIADKHINRHETVETGQPVVDFTGNNGFEVKACIPEKYFLMKDNFSKYRCLFSSYPEKPVDAKLKGIGSKALSPAKIYPLTVRLAKSRDIKIYAGMEVDILITISRPEEKKGIFVLPSSSVVSGADGEPVVWIYKKRSGTVISRPVKLGQLVSSGIEITSGLKNGEYVVSAGGNMLHNKQKVKPLTEFF